MDEIKDNFLIQSCHGGDEEEEEEEGDAGASLQVKTGLQDFLSSSPVKMNICKISILISAV